MHGIANLLEENGIMETEEQPPLRFAGANLHPSGGGEFPFLRVLGKGNRDCGFCFILLYKKKTKHSKMLV